MSPVRQAGLNLIKDPQEFLTYCPVKTLWRQKLQTDAVPVPSPKGVFTIGDYGTCDGTVSLRLIHKVIDHLRNKHGPDLKIQVLYEDHASNDYNSLFKTIYGQTSYMTKFTNVFPLVCGTNFYKQCVPDNTCDIIMSSFATVYLSNER
ncbi:hypothetical protein C0Q70_18112 [Pomacea canaliculata]|uniref:Uncharacterized protein n=1 Tax=Pomacea canaliculata TaxID=400727 RepID=A0A2T7NMB2_POMCA|nr:hypothetical protein C0Q70_18112 [Pomacea canaliculata]